MDEALRSARVGRIETFRSWILHRLWDTCLRLLGIRGEGRLLSADDVLHAPWLRCPSYKSLAPAQLEAFWRIFRRHRVARRVLRRWLERKHRALGTRALERAELAQAMMYLEVLLIDGDAARVGAIGDELTVHHSSDLRLQDVRARAMLIAVDPDRAADPTRAVKPFGDRFCPSTFDTLAFFEHEAFVCCCNYLPKSIGSIRAKSHDELWNSKVAQSARRSILEGAFEYCNKMVCPRLRNGDLPPRDTEDFEPYYREIIANGSVTSPGCYPRSIELNEDPSCNLSCPSCRIGPIGGDKPFLREFEQNVLPGVFEHEINSFLIACYGDPFASAHYLRVLHGLDPQKHRMRQLVIYTNGLLFTHEKWLELENLHGYKVEVRISIDAAEPETYRHVRRGGEWSVLMKNLEWIRAARREGQFNKLVLAFVVQDRNFEEMPAFVELGQRVGADEIFFAEMQPFGEFDVHPERYQAEAVHLQGHPRHRRFVEVLAHPTLSRPEVSLHGCRV